MFLVYFYCMFDIIFCFRWVLNVCFNVLNIWFSREKVKFEKGKIFGYISDSLNYNKVRWMIFDLIFFLIEFFIL